MDAGTAFGDVLADRRFRRGSFEQLDERVTSNEASYSSTIRIVEWSFWKAKDFFIERQDLAETTYSDADVRYARAPTGRR